VDVAGGTPREVIGDWRYEPGDIEWTPDGQILITAAIGGRTALFRVDPRTGALDELLGGRRRITGTAYDTAFSRVAFVATAIDAQTELCIANIDGTGERQLTSCNADLNREIAWSDAERFTYESVDGVEIEGWLMKPYGYQPGTQYPLAFYIHGGPHSSYG